MFHLFKRSLLGKYLNFQRYLIMNVTYRYFEPNSGLEEIQAEIYNTALSKYGNPNASAEQIRTRYESNNFDPKGVKYAFDNQGKPIAYIQTRKTDNRVFIGYPWAINPSNSSTKEVQTKLFDEMLAYTKEHNPKKDIVLGYIQSTWTEVLDFVKVRNFDVINKNMRYSFKVSDLAKIKVPEFKSRIANLADIPELVKLMDKEPSYENTFPNKEAATNFFKGCKNRNLISTFKII